jgi:predicted dehydrogenase
LPFKSNKKGLFSLKKKLALSDQQQNLFSSMLNRKIKMGMVGGGTDAFIGAVHRLAAFMDNQIELVCGCFSVDPEISKESGKLYYLPEDRVYESYEEMFEKEAQLPEGERMDFVSIVTPNFVHFDPAMMALDKGFNVVLDKPITFTLDEALQLKKKIDETGLTFALTHTYSGYPAVKHAKKMVADGEFGLIRKVFVEYPQGWLSSKLEDTGNPQASWRTDPKRSGKAGSMGDIGTHAHHLAEYITGLKVTELCAELKVFVPNRMLDDDGAALLRFDNGATGTLMATQIAAGVENAIKIRVYGDKGGLEWEQMEPNSLILNWLDAPMQVLRVGTSMHSDIATHNTRVPGGHPEGYLEAFANIYRNFSLTVRARANGEEPTAEMLDFPGVEDGIRGMQFIDTVVSAGYNDKVKWVKFGEE